MGVRGRGYTPSAVRPDRSAQCPPRVDPEVVTALSLTFAAVGAVIAAVLEATLVRHVDVGSLHLHLVLILAVLWTTVADIEGGLVVAFVGGLTLDALVVRPMGSTAFAIILAVGVAYLLARSMVRFRLIVPALAVLIGSALSSIVFLMLYGALRGPIPISDPLALALPSAGLDALVALILTPPAIALRDRAASPERVDW